LIGINIEFISQIIYKSIKKTDVIDILFMGWIGDIFSSIVPIFFYTIWIDNKEVILIRQFVKSALG